MSEHEPNHAVEIETLLKSFASLRGRLVRRWALRKAVFALTLGSLLASLLNLVATTLIGIQLSTPLVIGVALACSLAYFALLAFARPAPSSRDTALFAETAAHKEQQGGALELVIAGNHSPQLISQAQQTLDAIRDDAFAPPLRITGVLSLSASLVLLGVALFTLPSSISDHHSISTSATTFSINDQNNTNTSLLDRIRRELLAASPEQRATAQTEYAKLFARQKEALAQLEQSTEAGKQAALETPDDAQALKAAQQQQSNAVSAINNAKFGSKLDANDFETPATARELLERSHVLSQEAARLEAQHEALRHALITSQSQNSQERSSSSASTSDNADTTGFNATPGSLSEAQSGSIVIHQYDGAKPAKAAQAPLSKRQADVIWRYQRALAQGDD